MHSINSHTNKHNKFGTVSRNLTTITTTQQQPDEHPPWTEYCNQTVQQMVGSLIFDDVVLYKYCFLSHLAKLIILCHMCKKKM